MSGEDVIKIICISLLYDQAWYVNDNNLCRKRPVISTDATELSGYLRYDAINKMLVKHMVSSLAILSNVIFMNIMMLIRRMSMLTRAEQRTLGRELMKQTSSWDRWQLSDRSTR